MTSSPFKVFMERHKKTKTGLLLLVLLGAALVFSIGVLTPAISGKFTLLLQCNLFYSAIHASLHGSFGHLR